MDGKRGAVQRLGVKINDPSWSSGDYWAPQVGLGWSKGSLSFLLPCLSWKVVSCQLPGG